MPTAILSTRRGERNGALAAQWVKSQPSNIESEASDPATLESRLIEIGTYGTARLANMVAANKGASDTVLSDLLKRPNDQMLQRVACNPNASASTLSRILALDALPGNYRLQAKVAKHKNTAPQDLVAMLPTGGPVVVMGVGAVVFCVNTAPELAAAKNPNTPIADLASALKHLKRRDDALEVVRKRRAAFDPFMAAQGSPTSGLPDDQALDKICLI